MTLSFRVQRVKPSPTLAIAAIAAELQAKGADIINLGVGEPDFDTPDYIKQAAVDAIARGLTKYTAVDGTRELKQAIIEKLIRDNALNYELNQVLVSVGGKQSCYNLCQALLNPGDEVIIPAPYWVSYPDMVLLADATPIIVPTTYAQHYKITPTQLEAAITPQTKLFFLNSPSNPSGIAYTLNELTALSDVLMRHPQVLIATDDMYEHIQWSFPFCNILNANPKLYTRTIVLNGVSKAYAMTGWRIGYAAGPAPIINAMKTIQSQSTSNPCSISQYAAMIALRGGYDSIHMMRDAFKIRHDNLVSRLNHMPGVRLIPADGTFYLFPDVSAVIQRQGFANDLAFSEALLQKTGLAIVPGSAFGTEGCIRLSFAADAVTLKNAMDRLEQFIQ